jgi:hypothetical protein
MTLPVTPNVSLRDAIIWIAYGKAEPPEDLAGKALWLSREKEIKAARLSLWSALENGALEASAIGPDGPTIIGKHEWQFLFGNSISGKNDALYVSHGTARHLAFAIGSPRFTNVTVRRAAVLANWQPRLAETARVGRPSIMDQLESELDRWIAGGFSELSSQMKKHGQGGKKTMIGVARALEDWSIKNGLKASLDDAPKAEAIENGLRDTLRRAAELL